MRAGVLITGVSTLAVLLAGCSRQTAIRPSQAPPVVVRPDDRATATAERARKLQVAERSVGQWLDTGLHSDLGSPSTRAKESLRGADSTRALRAAPVPSAVPVGGAAASSVSDAARPIAGVTPAPRVGSLPAARARHYSDYAVELKSRLAEPEARGASPSRALAATRSEAETPSLEAGEVDDNRLFEKYLTYARQYQSEEKVHRFDASERYRIHVVNELGVGVPDAQVSVGSTEGEDALFRGRTNAGGRVNFFPETVGRKVPPALKLVAKQGESVATMVVERTSAGGEWTVRLTGAPKTYQGLTLDLLFLVDTTGSMSEEINRVRDTIQSVSAQIRRLPARPSLRLGIVLYRDREDEYVTRRRPFTTDVDAFQKALADVRADGGGDEPEDLNAGLQQAVEAMDWTPENAVRMMFVIADAPPHLDYHEEYDYFLAAQRSVEKGIQVVGVSTMGTNDTGEFVFRQLALLTQGRFVFVTRGGQEGITPHHVDRQDYSVQRLDSLIVRLVSEELASLGASRPQARAR